VPVNGAAGDGGTGAFRSVAGVAPQQLAGGAVEGVQLIGWTILSSCPDEDLLTTTGNLAS
jgi:hypothetical protein